LAVYFSSCVVGASAVFWFEFESVSQNMILAIEDDDVVGLSALLEAGADPNLGLPRPLVVAAGGGNPEIVGALLSAGADPNTRGLGGQTALMLAASEGHTQVVNMLLEQDADVNAQDDLGITALMLAAEGHTDVMETLLNEGADVNAATTADGWTAWMIAARFGHAEISRLFMEAGAECTESQIAAFVALGEGERFAWQGRIKDAQVAYANAQALDPTLTVPAVFWANLCLWGSLWGHAAEVMTVCEQAVSMTPASHFMYGQHRGSRGVARALTGDFEGAIADLDAFVAWSSNPEERAQARGWIHALRAGENPLTPEVLKQLQVTEIRRARQPTEGPMMRISAILVARQAEAQQLLERLNAGEEFATLAAAHSAGAGKDAGGDLGYFGPGELIPQLNIVALQLEVGQHSDIIATEVGFFIIKKTDEQLP
jgi:hypothetical protein